MTRYISGAVSSLQPLVQWICDLLVTLMSSLPVYSFTTCTGSWLAKDINFLTTIRHLLLLVRLWYNTVPRIRPVLSCNISFDVLARLFKLLTMLISSLREGIPLQDILVDECSLLSSQVTHAIQSGNMLEEVILMFYNALEVNYSSI